MFVIRGQCILNNVTKDTSCSLFKQRNKCLWKEELFVLWGGGLILFSFTFYILKRENKYNQVYAFSWGKI